MLKLSIAFIATILFFSGCSQKNPNPSLTHNLEKKESIYSIKSAKELSIKELVKELEHYPIIFIGDHHNTKKNS